MDETKFCDIGMVGLGVMGRNLLLNMTDHGFSVAGYDKDPTKVSALTEESKDHPIHAVGDIKQFIDSLRKPRAVMFLVPAGAPVDSVIQDLMPLLEPGDLIIDAGNSYFKDTDARAKRLAEKKINFLGVGVSGGEEGARHGPSIMPGGPKEAYERVRPILEAVSAKVKNEPCVTYLGSGSVGHFVKMVHNGIEYGIMQLIAESYDLMKRGLNLNNDQMRDIFTKWDQEELNCYLIEITSHIFGKMDDKSHHLLLDEIVGVAQQKGTGMWTSQSAMELQIPTPTIDLAVIMRDLSMRVKEREQAAKIYDRPIKSFAGNKETFVAQLQNALYAAMMITYAQGMALLVVASKEYDYHLELESVARIWRGGCIIRAKMLENICAAFKKNKDLPNLLLSPDIATLISEHVESLRSIVLQGCEMRIPIPSLMNSLIYFDAYRQDWMPANLIQAQRDYFGSHTYQLIGKEGFFHTQWEPK
jgi:6-phosphogluconate dehydrogenase